ncbi:oligodendrocyte transcription factor 3-like [Centruroides sculpturatus]|uniref:oligodendrocyte transcription factor 3-like n=1 Tax=Centruroides sculpturatus TaxID=218467 RepID=UPI000C6CD5A9|nr:oligodendrocyte transcription factor 3-like [Centruroides sculpturatus]
MGIVRASRSSASRKLQMDSCQKHDRSCSTLEPKSIKDYVATDYYAVERDKLFRFESVDDVLKSFEDCSSGCYFVDYEREGYYQEIRSPVRSNQNVLYSGDSSSQHRYHRYSKKEDATSRRSYSNERGCSKKYNRKKPLTQMELDRKRMLANRQERRRMYRLNAALEKLRQVIPTSFQQQSSKKLSKIKTLKLAISYISMLAKMLKDENCVKAICN